MLTSPISLTGKINVPTTIFSIVTILAQKNNAVNLGQGFPDFDCAERLQDLVTKYMKEGKNQYAPMIGVAPLREKLSDMFAQLYGTTYDPTEEITITAGATQAVFTAIMTVVKPGDEVIMFEPAFDCYVPAISLCGAKPVYISLSHPNYHIDRDVVAAAITPKTSMIIINTPTNPSGYARSQEDMLALYKVIENTNIIVLSDEVYEFMVYDGAKHISVASIPALAARSFKVGSFGKTIHATGWKVGYIAGPQSLMSAFRQVHQFNVYSVNTPVQYALAEYFSDADTYRGLQGFYQKKRDHFINGLKNMNVSVLPSAGTFFQLVDCRSIVDDGLSDRDICTTLIEQYKIASIPLGSFYHDNRDTGIMRFCFAKQESTLTEATSILSHIKTAKG